MTENGWGKHELLVLDKLDRLTLGQDELRRDVSEMKADLAGIRVQVAQKAALVAALVTILTVCAATIVRAL